MNPFLHPTVARPVAQPCSFRAPRAGRSRRARGRAAALALGLGLAAAGPAHALDLNAATAAQLDALKGIGPKTAQVIIDERQRGGPFASLQDLGERVRGLGPKRLKDLESAGLQASAKATPAAVPAGRAREASAGPAKR
ncbi:DNA uptake protein and related DNA-binding proteins [plant metagenome]